MDTVERVFGCLVIVLAAWLWHEHAQGRELIDTLEGRGNVPLIALAPEGGP